MTAGLDVAAAVTGGRNAYWISAAEDSGSYNKERTNHRRS